VKLNQIDPSSFEKHQEKSSAPLLVKLYGLTQKDYEYALMKLGELRRDLYERSSMKEENNFHRTQFRSEENHLLFLLAFPNL